MQARVLLASTKAAGMGLNVTCACRAIILDVWWNGAFEDQVRFFRLPTHHLALALVRGYRRCLLNDCLASPVRPEASDDLSKWATNCVVIKAGMLDSSLEG